MIREIRKVGDPILKTKAKKVEKIDEKVKELARDMIETMKFCNGVGLAAPQVGESLRIIVVDYEDNPIVLINPEIIEMSGEELDYEGCLSVPGVEVPVKRAERIVFKAQDLDGRTKKYRAKGLLARVVQHEVDHLDGMLILDRAVEETLKTEEK
ncbi:peptide deformylase [Dictyoglomus thermophilum]|uniref:Peptide deformylase n=1 Tax=Dictyoglomus thermophilum (strain ATCC 35947 / DSM 3960 / H-6-12) TaxID=309799 RepID=DEF_DICT6|nr:peptide deformylase [Dictyoglomus thermophilum]B5YF46.1 RecName: Full=Peptide deformylase; Short=PDF; AltName: Full=Polypeptide deformylase [Dictyoglomus thermophilum H-6-12]ACI19172.1 peptide deformylase [Dictyoglomus thermophilum H-6-12]